MASITHFLFLSLLFHCIFIVNCDDGPDDEDNLLQGLNQYRSSLNLPPLTHNNGIECLADDIADRYNNQPCPNTAPTQPKVSDYPDLITKCMLNNATLQGAQILPVCVPESQSAQLLNRYTASPYNTYLNDTSYSGIGIGSDDSWTIIILTAPTPATPGTPITPRSPATPSTPDDEEDRLLQGLNQYRSSLNLTSLTHNEGVECLADDIADRFNNQPCPNIAPTQPKVSDYPDLVTKCMLNNSTLQGAQILPVCLPDSQSAQLLTRYTTSPYNTYLNDTRFSSIGIGSDDNWTIIILTTAAPGTPGTPATPTTPGTPATPTTPGTPATGSSNSSNGATTPATGSSNTDSGAHSLTAISPVMILVIGFFMLV